jgi:hypothetical protein
MKRVGLTRKMRQQKWLLGDNENKLEMELIGEKAGAQSWMG